MSKRKPMGYWKDEQNVLREIAAWRAEHNGEFPTQRRLKETGDATLAAVIILRGGFRRLREQEGEAQLRQTSAHWGDFDRVRKAIEAWRATHGNYPSANDLAATGHSALASAITRHHGGFGSVRQRMGMTLDNRPNGYWKDFENVRAAITAFQETHGHFPSTDEIRRIPGARSLSGNIVRHHGGMNSVRAQFGVEIAQEQKDHWRDFENVRVRLEEFKRANGRLPTSGDLVAANLQSVGMAIWKYHGGFTSVRIRMGEADARTRMPKGHWRDFRNVAAAIREWADLHGGRFPTAAELVGTSLSSIPQLMTKHYGGAAAVRELLGFGPITDEAIAAHADALARIVPAIDSASALWSAMKRRWTARDLDAAVAAFETDGNLDRFGQLLTPSRE